MFVLNIMSTKRAEEIVLVHNASKYCNAVSFINNTILHTIT